MRIIGNGGHASVLRDGLDDSIEPGKYFVAIGDNATRKREVEALGAVPFTRIFADTSRASKSAFIGEGTCMMSGAVVSTRAVVGKHCIINTGATVDHDCILGDYVHIAPGAHLCGGVTVGDGALVGVGVGIAPGAIIPAWCIVKAARLDIEMVVP